MEEDCLICKSLSDGTTVIVKRDINTLRNASVEKNGKIEYLY